MFTYHNYVGYGLDPQLAPKIMDPSGKFFDSGPSISSRMAHTLRILYSMRTESKKHGANFTSRKI